MRGVEHGEGGMGRRGRFDRGGLPCGRLPCGARVGQVAAGLGPTGPQTSSPSPGHGPGADLPHPALLSAPEALPRRPMHPSPDTPARHSGWVWWHGRAQRPARALARPLACHHHREGRGGSWQGDWVASRSAGPGRLPLASARGRRGCLRAWQGPSPAAACPAQAPQSSPATAAQDRHPRSPARRRLVPAAPLKHARIQKSPA